MKRKLIWGVIICAGVAFLYLFYQIFSISHSINNEVRQEACSGTIRSITETQPCFATMMVEEQRQTVNLTVCTCGHTQAFWNFAKEGDIIEKKKGQLIVTVTKLKSGEKKEFEYPYCSH